MTLLFNINILYAMILGTIFGFILYRTGIANPKKIIAMLALKDFTIIKMILLSCAITSPILFILLQFNLLPSTHLQIRPSFVGVLIGGAIFGVGWAISGFSPASSLAALGTGSKRAITFILGGLVGALLYTLCHVIVRRTFLFYAISEGSVTLAKTGNTQFVALFPELHNVYIIGAIAIVSLIIAILLPPTKK